MRSSRPVESRAGNYAYQGSLCDGRLGSRTRLQNKSLLRLWLGLRLGLGVVLGLGVNIRVTSKCKDQGYIPLCDVHAFRRTST